MDGPSHRLLFLPTALLACAVTNPGHSYSFFLVWILSNAHLHLVKVLARFDRCVPNHILSSDVVDYFVGDTIKLARR